MIEYLKSMNGETKSNIKILILFSINLFFSYFFYIIWDLKFHRFLNSINSTNTNICINIDKDLLRCSLLLIGMGSPVIFLPILLYPYHVTNNKVKYYTIFSVIGASNFYVYIVTLCIYYSNRHHIICNSVASDDIFLVYIFCIIIICMSAAQLWILFLFFYNIKTSYITLSQPLFQVIDKTKYRNS